jgi:diketogulonate reductase-like aldo/keto reductase
MKSLSVAGIDIPVLGLGVWQIERDCADVVADAIAAGYRHVDTAFVYGNEKDVGEGVRRSGVPRDQIHVTTKVWRDYLGAGDLQKAAEGSLKTLGMDYVDLLLIHWPNSEVPLEEMIGALNEVKRRGLTRAIGVANFPSALFEEAANLSEAPLATNQVEYHPYLSQRAVLETVRRHHSSLTAYSPLARGALARDPLLAEIGKPHGKSATQVGLRWFVQQDDVITIPKSASPERLRQNIDVWDFALTDEEMVRISALARPDGRLIDGFGVQWDAD